MHFVRRVYNNTAVILNLFQDPAPAIQTLLKRDPEIKKIKN